MKIVVGVGIHSVSGSRLDRILRLLVDDPAEYEVIPIYELPYARGRTLHDLQHRAIRYAERMRDLYPGASLHIGIAGGIVPYRTKVDEGPAYVDIMTNLVQDKNGDVHNWLLNNNDAHRQVRERRYYLASCEESVTNMAIRLQDMLRANAKPRS